MEFAELLLINIIVKYIYGFCAAYVIYKIADKRIPVVKLLAALILFALAEGGIVPLILYNDVQTSSINSGFTYLGITLAECFIDLTFFAFLLKEYGKRQVFFFVAVASIFTYDMMLFSLTIISAAGLDGLFYDVNIDIAIATLLLTVIVFTGISKCMVIHLIRKLGEYPKLYISMGVLYYFLNILFGFSQEGYYWWAVVYLVVMLAIAFIVRDIENQKAIRESRILLLQQQSYVKRLERLQRELRMIQHDYKNVIAGLYAQVNEGNLEAVKTYIDSKLLQIDGDVKEDVRQMNQLTMIQLMELKGLILTKIIEAEQCKTKIQLEVMNKVDHVNMQTEDLLRCVGILLDNAIEETKKQEKASVILLILQEAGKLTIVVKNPVRSQPDLENIWQEGYSTKGGGRGLGLSIFQRIIRKYPEVLHEVKVEDYNFSQVLTIGEST